MTITLPVALGFYTVGLVTSWNTTWRITSHGMKTCTIQWGTAPPAGAECLATIQA
jgi:hypothetical protein